MAGIDCYFFGTLHVFHRYLNCNPGVTSSHLIPSADVVSSWDGCAPPPGCVPTTIGIPRQNALPATVSIATAVSQWYALDLHCRAHIKVALGEKAEKHTVVITRSALFKWIGLQLRHKQIILWILV